ncbi:MAG: response regulator transcription factor [Sandaracinaceae bacterium]
MSSSAEAAPSVLVVDDDERFRERLARAFERRGWEVRQAASGEQALGLAAVERPEHVVLDLRMEGMSGLEVLRRLHALDPESTIVVLTGYGSIATALEAVRRGAVHYLTKPADIDEILQAFQRGSTAGGPVEPPSTVPSLARAEWEHIQRVLTDCDGNISRAARLLGLHRRTLQRKLAKFPVPR